MKSGKTIETAQRALEILKDLMYKDMSVDDILDNLCSQRDFGVVYTKEAIYKYLNTFKAIGIKIEKNQGAYCVKNSFFRIKLTEEEKSTLFFLENYLYGLNNTEYIDKFGKIKKLLIKNNADINANILPVDFENIISKKYKSYSKIIEQLEKACRKKDTLVITYKLSEDETITDTFVPDKLIIKNGFLVLFAFNREHFDYSEILVENILSISFSPQHGNTNFFKKIVVFRLKDELAKNYKLKKYEQLQESGDDYIVVVNKGQNLREFVKRVFRYSDKCKIEYSVDFRAYIKEKIDKSLALYKD